MRGRLEGDARSGGRSGLAGQDAGDHCRDRQAGQKYAWPVNLETLHSIHQLPGSKDSRGVVRNVTVTVERVKAAPGTAPGGDGPKVVPLGPKTACLPGH